MTIQTESIDAKAVAALRSRFRGVLPQPGEEGYDEARRIWNGAIDRHPALIAWCAGTDVVEAVRFARERNLPVPVKGGGHSGDRVPERRTVRVSAIPEIRARRVDEPGRFVEVYPTGPSSGAVTTAQPDGSVLAGQAPGQAERLSPLFTFPSALGGALCVS